MKNLFLSTLVIVYVLLIACTTDADEAIPNVENVTMYFPPKEGNAWESYSLSDLGWDTSQTTTLYDYLEANNTRAFIVLKNGKLVIEEYWGTEINSTNTFTQDSPWYWASAGKSLTAFLVGIAQQEGYLNIQDKTADYLGTGWTSMSLDNESKITLWHQLTMTTGLDYTASSLDCTDPECLKYGAAPGTQWYYHNAPYTLLEAVVSNATETSYNNFTNETIEATIGMNGQWLPLGYNNVYWSSARDMARFGLLILNKGQWEDNTVLSDSDYFEQMVNSSQSLNPSYGYLWWLNGKNTLLLPTQTTPFPMPLASYAPDDLIAGMGKNGQFVDVVPSEGLVVIRMGEAPSDALVPIEFHNQMWQKLNIVLGLEQ